MAQRETARPSTRQRGNSVRWAVSYRLLPNTKGLANHPVLEDHVERPLGHFEIAYNCGRPAGCAMGGGSK